MATCAWTTKAICSPTSGSGDRISREKRSGEGVRRRSRSRSRQWRHRGLRCRGRCRGGYLGRGSRRRRKRRGSGRLRNRRLGRRRGDRRRGRHRCLRILLPHQQLYDRLDLDTASARYHHRLFGVEVQDQYRGGVLFHGELPRPLSVVNCPTTFSRSLGTVASRSAAPVPSFQRYHCLQDRHPHLGILTRRQLRRTKELFQALNLHQNRRSARPR